MFCFRLKDLDITELVQVCISQMAENIVSLTDALTVEQLSLHKVPDDNLKVR